MRKEKGLWELEEAMSFLLDLVPKAAETHKAFCDDAVEKANVHV